MGRLGAAEEEVEVVALVAVESEIGVIAEEATGLLAGDDDSAVADKTG